MTDSFYTPHSVAQSMVNGADLSFAPSVIADFAVGDGALLKAATVLWPRSHFLGTDINETVVQELASREPTWWIARCDFFFNVEKVSSRKLQKLKGGIDLILLNPPFSNRGARRKSVEFNKVVLKCSKGLAFVINALNYLSDRGQLIAVLPAGTLQSEMDASAWKEIFTKYRRTKLGTNSDKTFTGCLAKTVIVKLSRRKVLRPAGDIASNTRIVAPPDVCIVKRGRVDMPSISFSSKSNAIDLIHTTDLVDGRVTLSGRRVREEWATFSGHAVLLPRVGRPNVSKVCAYSAMHRPVACSNCIMIIPCQTLQRAQALRENIAANWASFRRLYAGTCAQYITVSRLTEFLSKHSNPLKSAASPAAIPTFKYRIR